MKRKYKLLLYIFLFECIILLVFNLNSNRVLRFYTTKQNSNQQNESQTISDLILAIKNHQNEYNSTEYKCDKYSIEANNEIALKNYRDNIKRYMPEFNKCYLKESASNLIQITSFQNESYLIEINLEKLLIRYELNNSTRIKCNSEQFDKQVNIKERNWSLNTTRKYEFNQYLTQLVESDGFYYVYCESNQTVFYEDVFLILPINMSIIKEKKQVYFDQINTMKVNSLSLDIENNTMLNDFDLISDKKCRIEKSLNDAKMNVLIIGIDSLSYPHLKRSFPRFYNYINNELGHNVLFENFNKIGENTYPNLLALFAGVKIEPFYEQNINETDIDFFTKLDSTNHDLIPFIWKSYHELDYLSMYNEEWPYYGCFNYLKNGFRFYPSHYYSHPYWFKYDLLNSRNNNSKLCLNNEPTYSKSINKINQIITQMNSFSNKKLAYFSFNFFKYYTHDYLVTPTGFDAELTSLIRKFEQNGYLDNTLLILMSDHGSRLTHYGFYTDPGRLERSMPFLTVRLPKQLWNTDFELNLKSNKDKLVTMFDLYKTLRHFYYLNKYDTKTLIDNKICRYNFTFSSVRTRSMRGVSLFERIDTSRTCLDALIPNSYCLCSSKVELNETMYFKETNKTFNETGQLLVDFVNSQTYEYRSKCDLFRLDHIKSVKKTSYTSNIKLYSFQFILQPGESVFEANMHLKNKLKLEVYENKVNRLSKYRNQSKCIATSKTRHLLGFCYCKQIQN